MFGHANPTTNSTMKRHNCLSFIFFIFLISQSLAQTALHGIVHHQYYAGAQPDLVMGVSSLPATSKPLVRHVWLADKNILVITIDERSVIHSNLKPYEPREGDSILYEGYHGYTKILKRGGYRTGYICGPNDEWFRNFNAIAGEVLDITSLEPDDMRVSSQTDFKFSGPEQPEHVWRKTYPINKTHMSLEQEYPLRHDIFIEFDREFSSGNKYTIHLNNPSQLPDSITFSFHDHALRSEAVQVNLLGFAPDDKKTAYLSVWMGEGGSCEYKEDFDFKIVRTEDSQEIFAGKSVRRTSGDHPEYEIDGEAYNHSLTDVLEMDFSEVKDPGSYKVVVEGIGCSFSFDINRKVWSDMSHLLMKGYLHQRSGIALGPPYTDYLRPLNMHPDAGLVIHKCDPDLFFNPPGEISSREQKAVFERVKASILWDTEIPQAWGGWMDAGDFDQRMTHLWAVRRMAYLHDLRPTYFSAKSFGMPESKNEIPDILDEGMWGVDVFRRTQGIYADGAVSWWVEAVEHPHQGETSWTHSIPTALVPPTPRASILYAATAAQLSESLRNYDPEKSEEYLQSALDAMHWVDLNPDAPDVFGRKSRTFYESLASLHLYRRTGEQIWHEKYKQTIDQLFQKGITADISQSNYEVLVGYLMIDRFVTDADLSNEIKKALVNMADDLLEGAAQNTYSILNPTRSELDRMSTLGNKILPVVMAHVITREPKYLDALVSTVQYTMGANPMNRSYISGLGERWFEPFHHDWAGNNTPMPAGIPNYGPTKQTETRWGWRDAKSIKGMEATGLFPNILSKWPHAEKCFNGTWMPPVNEFTVSSPMGDLLLLSGYLASLAD